MKQQRDGCAPKCRVSSFVVDLFDHDFVVLKIVQYRLYATTFAQKKKKLVNQIVVTRRRMTSIRNVVLMFSGSSFFYWNPLWFNGCSLKSHLRNKRN